MTLKYIILVFKNFIAFEYLKSSKRLHNDYINVWNDREQGRQRKAG